MMDALGAASPFSEPSEGHSEKTLLIRLPPGPPSVCLHVFPCAVFQSDWVDIPCSRTTNVPSTVVVWSNLNAQKLLCCSVQGETAVVISFSRSLWDSYCFAGSDKLNVAVL